MTKIKINKKGAAYGKDFAFGIIIIIIFLVFMFSGGLLTVIKLTSTLKSIPPAVWYFVGIVILIKLFKGKR